MDIKDRLANNQSTETALSDNVLLSLEFIIAFYEMFKLLVHINPLPCTSTSFFNFVFSLTNSLIT